MLVTSVERSLCDHVTANRFVKVFFLQGLKQSQSPQIAASSVRRQNV